MSEAISTPAAITFERTVADLKDGVATATTTYRNMSEKAVKSTSDAVAFGKGTLEAYTEASQIFTSGSQELFKQFTASSQQAMQESLSGFRALMGVKTAKEAIELHTSITRTAAAWAVTEGSRFAQAGLDLVEKASAPLTARAMLAADKVATLKA